MFFACNLVKYQAIYYRKAAHACLTAPWLSWLQRPTVISATVAYYIGRSRVRASLGQSFSLSSFTPAVEFERLAKDDSE